MSFKEEIKKLITTASEDKLEEVLNLLIKPSVEILIFLPSLVLSKKGRKLLYLDYSPVIGEYQSQELTVPYYESIKIYPLNEIGFIASSWVNGKKSFDFYYNLETEEVTELKALKSVNILVSIPSSNDKEARFLGVKNGESVLIEIQKKSVKKIKISKSNITTSPNRNGTVSVVLSSDVVQVYYKQKPYLLISTEEKYSELSFLQPSKHSEISTVNYLKNLIPIPKKLIVTTLKFL